MLLEKMLILGLVVIVCIAFHVFFDWQVHGRRDD